ncbi:MAG: FlgD immunoglobulin-like domain containing protein [bacterium]|nr:FlgD immunoglobulin-like domain containing protein [bacterium]
MLDIEKATNGQDADLAPGPQVVVGSTVTWTYVVGNVGNVPLTDIEVVDNLVGTIGTIASLAPGADSTLTTTGLAVLGQYENTATATATYDGQQLSDSDPSHYYGEGPTNIELSAFYAEARQDSIVINWTTETEPNNAGFNIFRSSAANGTYGKVNVSMITALGNAITGASYSYVDRPDETGDYYYKLQSVSLDGNTSFHGPVFVGLTAVAMKKYAVPNNYSLSQNYPNPFNPETTIEFSLPKADFVELAIYDISGKIVRTLISEQKQAGTFRLKWDGRDENGALASSGIYFTIMKSGDFQQMNKMILMK